MSSSGPEDQLASAMGSAAAGIVILGIVLAAWFLVKAFELVVKVLIAHPRNKPTWLALVGFLLFASAAAIAGWHLALLNLLAAGSFVALLAVAKVVEIYYDERLRAELSREYLTDQVLHQPWWALEAA